MTKIIIGTHGMLSTEILKSAEMIMGEQEEISIVTFVPGEGLEDLLKKYNNSIKELGNPDELLFMLDLFGGSPFNAASTLAIQNEGFEIITGINLPMLLEVLSLRDDLSAKELVKAARESGTVGIINFEKVLDTEEEEF